MTKETLALNRIRQLGICQAWRCLSQFPQLSERKMNWKKIAKLEADMAFGKIISNEVNWEKGYCGNQR